MSLVYLSLGAGVQSTAMLVMSALGLKGCPRASVAIFADTGDEPAWVYEHLAWCRNFGESHGVRVETVTAGHLGANILAAARGERTRFGTIPAFTDLGGGGSGPLRRQCTREYKIEPIEKRVRELVGLGRGVRAPRGQVLARGLIGISTDEAVRMKDARKPWIKHLFPLIEASMDRAACLRLLAEHGAPRPEKSSCVFCPYHSDAFWLRLKQDHPGEFERAAVIDDAVRNLTGAGVERPAFLHRSLKPLREVDFLKWRDKPGQAHFGFLNECEGMCGV
jgi:hypothetical protein